MFRKLLFVLVVLLAGIFFLIKAQAETTQIPSLVYLEDNKLMVKKPHMAGARPYLIKGVTWQPATRAPSNGPDPLNTTETIPYGFFFDWHNRNPVGSEILGYWMKNQILENYQSDIALMKDMNINTVRVYSDFYNDFEDNVEAYMQVLDEFYNNDIMVIMSVAISRDDFEGKRFYVYYDQNHPLNHFTPSGWIGDIGDLALDEGVTNPAPYLGGNCLKISYAAQGPQNWAGIYWQFPPHNWGSVSGLDIQRFVKLVFWARGANGGEKIPEVKIGGISGDTASVAYPDAPIILTNQWQQYSIDLQGYDLSDIRGGFYISFSKAQAAGAQTIYLDNIYYVSEPKRYEQVVNLFKDHSAILMWSIGNEWNINNFYGYSSFDEAAAAVNQAAPDIKGIDPNHPVSSCLGDIFSAPSCDPYDPCCNLNLWTVGDCVASCPDVDLWGMNVYRGQSFYNLFSQWEEITAKPLYLSEFGIDSFGTSSFDPEGCYFAINCTGAEDQSIQAAFALNLWSEIEQNISSFYPGKSCLGGLIHEFNDELWKVGSFHVGLGGLVDYSYDTSYDEYNTEGAAAGGPPDNVFNEEYFGVVDADRNPKQIFNSLKQYYGQLLPVAPSGLEARVAFTPSPELHYISLRWVDNSDNEDGFIIERRVSTSPPKAFQEIAGVGPNVTFYRDQDDDGSNDLVPGITYVYRLRAYRGDILSGYSDEVSVAFCFIATAAYGSYTAEEVGVLVRIRDQHLMRSIIGRKFVDLYYKCSPSLARYISDKPKLRAAVRLLLKPLVWISSNIIAE